MLVVPSWHQHRYQSLMVLRLGPHSQAHNTANKDIGQTRNESLASKHAQNKLQASTDLGITWTSNEPNPDETGPTKQSFQEPLGSASQASVNNHPSQIQRDSFSMILTFSGGLRPAQHLQILAKVGLKQTFHVLRGNSHPKILSNSLDLSSQEHNLSIIG